MGNSPVDKGLKRALRNPELLSMLSPLLAASFGVVPIKKQPGALLLASFPGMHVSALRVLREILAMDVSACPTRPRLMHEAIEEGYFSTSRGGVNFNTFLDQDFLEDPENISKLASEKSDTIGAAICTLPDWEVLLLDLDYRSKLVRLDFPSIERPGFVGGALDIVMRSTDTGARLFSPLEPRDGACLVVQSFEFRDGVHFEHGIRGCSVENLPHVIHPSEVQLARIDQDGTAEFFVYDRFIKVAPGECPTLEVDYYFLWCGHRHRRSIEVSVRDIRPAPRHSLEWVDGESDWTGDDLARWFGIS